MYYNAGWRPIGGFTIWPLLSCQINGMQVSENAKMPNLLFASLAV